MRNFTRAWLHHAFPQKGFWDAADSKLYVSCVWSKRVDVFSLQQENSSVSERNAKGTIDVPLWPSAMMMIRDELLVTDHFGADACRISTTTQTVTKRKDWFGSSVRSLVEIPTKGDEPKKIGVMHTVLNEFARTNPQDIQWGVLLTNDFRIVNVDRLLDDQETNVYRDGQFHPVGIPGNGARNRLTSACISRRDKLPWRLEEPIKWPLEMLDPLVSDFSMLADFRPRWFGRLMEKSFMWPTNSTTRIPWSM